MSKVVIKTMCKDHSTSTKMVPKMLTMKVRFLFTRAGQSTRLDNCFFAVGFLNRLDSSSSSMIYLSSHFFFNFFILSSFLPVSMTWE